MLVSSSILDHPIIVFIILIAAVLRWLSQKSERQGPDPERPVVPDEPIPRSDPQSEEERMRRFLEALGRPPTSAPPPKVIRRTVTVRRVEPKSDVWPKVRPFQPSVFREPLPPLTTVPPPLPNEPQLMETVTTSTAQPAPPLSPEQRIPQSETTLGVETLDFTAHLLNDPSVPYRSDILHLASIQDLRRAIILREVLGPPLGLQPQGRAI